jgi:tetratricopeptide (TPR) repeat protein/cell division protein FtsN
MKRYLTIVFLLLITSSISFSQNWNDIFYMETEADYALEEKKYDKAIEIYQKILKKVPESALIKFKIGITYLKTDDQKHLSISFLEDAVKDVAKDFDAKSISETRAPIEAHLYLGFAYQSIGKISEALTSYKNYKSLIDEKDMHYSLVNQYIESCLNAEAQLKAPRNIKTVNLGETINDKNSNFNAVVSGDGNTMAFTSYTANYIDLFVAKKTGEIWSKPKNVSDQVSKKFYLKTTGISYDGTKLYLATDDPINNDLFESSYDGTKWENAKKMDKVFNTKSNETHASSSKDGNTIYFTSDRPGGLGGLDIYKSTKDEKGKWGPAINLGSKINTPFNEETPFITTNDKYLFFSSQGHSSIGGYDIFYTDLTGDQEVINIGYPINTTGNDLFYLPGENLQTGYLSMHDKKSLGKNDIYQINIAQEIILKGTIAGLQELAQSPFTIILLNKENNETVNSLTSYEPNFKCNIIPGNFLITIVNDKYNTFSQDIYIPEDFAMNEYLLEANMTIIEEVKPELVAEIIEPVVEPTIEPVIETQPEPREEIAVITPVIEEITEPEPLVEEPKVEVQPEVVKEPEPIEVAKPKPAVNIEIASTDKKSYSVQIMALKKAVDIDYFSNLQNIVVTLTPDGFYRYTVGYTVSYAEVTALKEKIQQLGYTTAFVKINSFIPNYTIQLMALKAPVDLSYFKELPIVSVTKGADEFYRYTFGAYESVQKAKEDLQKLKELGYKQVFIKKVETDLSLANK